VNVVVLPGGLGREELAALGVARISFGGGLAHSALEAAAASALVMNWFRLTGSRSGARANPLELAAQLRQRRARRAREPVLGHAELGGGLPAARLAHEAHVDDRPLGLVETPEGLAEQDAVVEQRWANASTRGR
jgi:hypothetical protein